VEGRKILPDSGGKRKSGDWYYFKDYEGDKGWVHRSLVKDIPTAITIKEKCNVRSGPGKENPVVFTVGSGIPFKVIGKKGNWRHILHADGDKGWIYKSLLW
jgi:SH3-like domain-containing protein